MAKRTAAQPTPAELAILNALWEHGPSTVRDVWQRLGGERRTGYTTVLKLLQIMAAKGLVTRDDRRHSHVFAAARSEEQTQRALVRDLLERAFGGSARKLILRALDAHRVSPGELAEIRALLDQLEGGAK